MAKKATLGFSTLALLLVVFGAYYLYVSEREAYFVDRNFRLLALWSNKLSEMVEEEFKHQFQYIISVSSENDDEQDTCGKTKLQQECQPIQCLENANKEGDDKPPFLCRFIEEFEKQNEQLEKKLILVSICPESKSLERSKFFNEQPSIKAQLFPNDKDRLRLTYEREYERKSEEAQQLCKKTVYKNGRCKGEKCKSIGKETIQVDLSISKLLRRLVTDQAFNDTIITEHAFSDVIVFDSETGTVHFQANHSQANHSSFRLDDFRDLVAQRPDTSGLFSFFSESSETTKIENNKSGSSKSLPLKDLLQNPTHQQMIIGDISYELFTQPIVLSELTIKKQTHYKQLVIATDVGATELTLQHYKKDDPARLILAGFVKTEKFQSEYRAIPHTSLLIFLLFVLLGLLSLPIIHLGFMDAHERLSRIHVFSLLVTCISGTALLTLLLLDVVWLNNVRHNLDEQLKETAQHIKKTFSYELTQSLNLLHAYDHSEAFEEDFNWATEGGNYLDIYRHPYAGESNRTYGGTSKKDRWVARKEYPYLCNEKHKRIFPYHCDYDPVFWVDRNKNVRIIWTPRPEYYFQTSKVSLAHREYVKRILAPEPRRSLWYTKDGHPAFYVQSLLSLETGNHTVVFSMESSRPEDKPQKWVAAIETEFQFLKAEAIPDGTGFAVIEDEGGRVLFHSDDNRSLWENFFEETDDNAQLKAHVFSRTAGKAEGNYWGKGHSFYSVPLPAVPWSVVVFRNKELFRTTNFEALLLAVILFVLYVGISSIVPTAIWLFSKARRRKMPISWLWPDSDRPYWHYICISLILFAFFLVGLPLFGCDVFPDGYSVWFVFSYPLVSLLVLCFLRSFWPDSVRPSRCWISIALVFVLFFSGSLLLFWRGGLEDYAPWIVLLNPIGISIFLCYLTKVSPRCSGKISSDHGPEGLHCRYAFAVISFLLLFSALPMGIFFKVGTDREMALAMKYNLITLGQKLRQTPDLDFSQIQREIRGVDTSSPMAECAENGYRGNCNLLKHSIHLNPLTKTTLYVSDKKPSANSYSRLEPSFLEKMCVRTDPGADDCNHTEPSSPLEKLHKFIRANSLSRLSNPVSVSTLGLIDEQSPGNPFHWRYDSSPSIALDFQASLKPSDSQTKWVILRSWSSSDIWPSSAKSFFWGAAVLIAFVLMLIGVPIFIVSRIFPVLRKSPVDENSYQEKTKENSNKKEEKLLIIGSPESLDSYRQENLPADQWEPIDCRQISDPLWWKVEGQVLSTQKAGVILQHFEYQFGVPTFDRSKLSLLAALLVRGKQIRVLSTINPLKLDREDGSGPSFPDETMHTVPKHPVPVSLQEWSQVFQTFTLQKGPAPVSLREWSRVFQLFTLQYASLDPKSTSTESDARPDLIPTYEAIWQARTTDEKITLYHLARDGFVHVENSEMGSLFALGLIKFNPDSRWLEDDFEKYVLNAAQRDELDASEREKRQGRWDVWKWPLAIVLIVLGMGLLLTQQEFKNVVVLMLSILPVLPSALSELFGSMGKAGKSS